MKKYQIIYAERRVNEERKKLVATVQMHRMFLGERRLSI